MHITLHTVAPTLILTSDFPTNLVRGLSNKEMSSVLQLQCVAVVFRIRRWAHYGDEQFVPELQNKGAKCCAPLSFSQPRNQNQSITGWRRPIGCLKLQVIFRKRATNYRALDMHIIIHTLPHNTMHIILHTMPHNIHVAPCYTVANTHRMPYL